MPIIPTSGVLKTLIKAGGTDLYIDWLSSGEIPVRSVDHFNQRTAYNE